MYTTYLTGEITLHTAQIVNKEQLQRHMPRSTVCFRYIILNTLHKGDNKDNNNNSNNNKFSSISVIIIIKLHVITR